MVIMDIKIASPVLGACEGGRSGILDWHRPEEFLDFSRHNVKSFLLF